MYTENDETNLINHYGLIKLKGKEKVQRIMSEYYIKLDYIYKTRPTSGKTSTMDNRKTKRK